MEPGTYISPKHLRRRRRVGDQHRQIDSVDVDMLPAGPAIIYDDRFSRVVNSPGGAPRVR